MSSIAQSILQRSNIESNKQFQRLSEKTQVLLPQNGLLEVSKTRLTHSYEVATSSLLIAAFISEKMDINVSDIDYQNSLFNISLLHDIGHPPFGHDGAGTLNSFFINKGLEEGFSDNNNNLIVIEKNNIIVSDYTMVSTIKYPDRLYEFQKKMYHPMLRDAIEQDKKHYKKIGIDLKNQKTTIACQIMDEADRNSYICSDLADFICLGNTISIRDLKYFAKKCKLKYRYSELSTLSNIIKSSSKTSIKAYFNDLKNKFNKNFIITENGLEVIDKDLMEYREFLGRIEFEFFIKPIQQSENHIKNLKKFEDYIYDVFENKYFPSTYYKDKIESSKNEKERLTFIRDMIAEVTDWYILNYYKENKE